MATSIPALLAGRVVVLGASASGAGDRFTTPFSARLPGSEHLATAIDNILSDRSLRRGTSARALDRLLTAVMALAAALLAGRRSPWLSLLVLGALLAALAGLLQFAFVAHRIWLAALPPTVAMLAAGWLSRRCGSPTSGAAGAGWSARGPTSPATSRLPSSSGWPPATPRPASTGRRRRW